MTIHPDSVNRNEYKTLALLLKGTMVDAGAC
jgi:hypothetical protein